MDAADDLLAFIHAAPTPWHAVDEAARRLDAAGFVRLDERERWELRAGSRAYVTRAGSTIAAFEVGAGRPEEQGLRLIGAHTDSPNLRVKPQADVRRHGQVQIAVEPYGGVLFHTWVDRDLGIAGRVVLRGPRGPESALVRIDRSIARIPSLAIHLDRTVNEALTLNAQTHLVPLLGLESASDRGVVDLAIAALGRDDVSRSDVLGFDLCTFDVVPPTRSGASGELLHAPRLDNLGSCHAALSALLAASPAPAATRAIFLFDHEECGSASAQGAQGPFLRDVLARVIDAHPDVARDAWPRAMARSFFVSADMAHALHPNYADRHEPGHQPMLGGGPVIKSNSNQRYATDGETAARFRDWCARAEVTPQAFVTRSDLPCGSTIGPLTAAGMGIRAVDVGSAMLSMHSCRELAAAADVPKMIDAMRAFLESESAG